MGNAAAENSGSLGQGRGLVPRRNISHRWPCIETCVEQNAEGVRSGLSGKSWLIHWETQSEVIPTGKNCHILVAPSCLSHQLGMAKRNVILAGNVRQILKHYKPCHFSIECISWICITVVSLRDPSGTSLLSLPIWDILIFLWHHVWLLIKDCLIEV